MRVVQCLLLPTAEPASKSLVSSRRVFSSRRVGHKARGTLGRAELGPTSGHIIIIIIITIIIITIIIISSSSSSRRTRGSAWEPPAAGAVSRWTGHPWAGPTKLFFRSQSRSVDLTSLTMDREESS